MVPTLDGTQWIETVGPNGRKPCVTSDVDRLPCPLGHPLATAATQDGAAHAENKRDHR